jgi:hypothetical protein
MSFLVDFRPKMAFERTTRLMYVIFTVTVSSDNALLNKEFLRTVYSCSNAPAGPLYATLRPHRSRPVLLGVDTSAHLGSALAVLLSRTPLDLVAGASHCTKNHPIETPQLSLPPCPMRVDLTNTGCNRRMTGWPVVGSLVRGR